MKRIDKKRNTKRRVENLEACQVTSEQEIVKMIQWQNPLTKTKVAMSGVIMPVQSLEVAWWGGANWWNLTVHLERKGPREGTDADKEGKITLRAMEGEGEVEGSERKRRSGCEFKSVLDSPESRGILLEVKVHQNYEDRKAEDDRNLPKLLFFALTEKQEAARNEGIYICRI